MGAAVIISGPMLAGMAIRPLVQIKDERGAIMHMLRADQAEFESFGEIYFSLVRPGVVKAWKRHRRMVQNFAVPVGEIRLVLYDDRPGSPTSGKTLEIITGADRYALIRIPPLLWYGFQGIAPGDSMIANCASIPHDPAESEGIPPDNSVVPYRWTA